MLSVIQQTMLLTRIDLTWFHWLWLLACIHHHQWTCNMWNWSLMQELLVDWVSWLSLGCTKWEKEVIHLVEIATTRRNYPKVNSHLDLMSKFRSSLSRQHVGNHLRPHKLSCSFWIMFMFIHFHPKLFQGPTNLEVNNHLKNTSISGGFIHSFSCHFWAEPLAQTTSVFYGWSTYPPLTYHWFPSIRPN